MQFDPIVTIVLVVLCVIEVKQHNKTVCQSWPDITDPHQEEQRRRFTIEPVAHYLLLGYSVIVCIARLIGILK